MIENKSVKSGGVQFVTIVAQNYLAYALVLGESVARFHPHANFSIFLVDDVDRRWKPLIESRGFAAIYPEQIPLAEYRKFVFQYNVTEASTGVKPFVMQMLFEHGADTVVYLDPDTLCFRALDETFAALEHSSIVLTPHICSPAPDEYYPGESDFLKSGAFNLGFLALRNDRTAAGFLRWWAAHLKRDCVQEPDAGLFVDQKWIDLVPTCFGRVHILRCPAYNVAYWNLHERFLDERDGILYESQSGHPVAFMHFSGIGAGNADGITKYAQRNPLGRSGHKKRYTLAERADLAGTFRMYLQLLEGADNGSFSQLPYTYATYDNGQPICQLERSLYLGSAAWREISADPFRAQPGSFWDACRKAGIRSKSVAAAKSPAEETTRKYGTYMRAIEIFLKCCLRVLGPDQYLNFSKYMRHQFLPLNQGFILPEPEKAPATAKEAVSREREGYAKPACDPPEI